MEKTLSLNLNGIPQTAKQIAKNIKGGEIFALIGPLGSGKTTFTQALGRQLKIRQRITSPTFTLLNCIPAKLPKNNKKIAFYHLDLYRTKTFAEAKALGLTEFWGMPHTVTLIEWADRIRRHLPNNATIINFKGQ